MSVFHYEAKRRDGASVQGTITAPRRAAAISLLRQQGLAVTLVEARVDLDGAARAKKLAAQTFRLKMKTADLALFTRQLATLTSQGIPVGEGLSFLAEQSERGPGRRICTRLAHLLRDGNSLGDGLQEFPRAFSPLYVAMTRAAEESGQMDIILERMADHLEASYALRRDILAAATYPLVSALLVLGGTAFLLLGIVPSFREAFSDLGTELPALTSFLLNLSEWLRASWMQIAAGAAALVIAVTLFLSLSLGAWIKDVVQWRTPILGKVVRKIAFARFARTFSTLLKSGVPIMRTLEIVAEAAGNRVIGRAVLRARDEVLDGGSLAEAMEAEPAFPLLLVRMTAVGERVGSIEALLEKVADFYEAQARAAIRSLVSMLEPLMVLVLGFVLGTVVLSIFLALLKLLDSLH